MGERRPPGIFHIPFVCGGFFDQRQMDSVKFAFVDFDFYQPIKIVLEKLDKVIVNKGIIVVHDYNFFSAGVKTAIDEFLSDNAGLVVAEIELHSENEHYTKPAWIASEVTGQVKYYNASLSNIPFKLWA